jgi:hypothetical protein
MIQKVSRLRITKKIFHPVFWAVFVLSGFGACGIDVVSAAANTPTILYTDITSGPMTGGENNKGVWLSVFGMNFGSNQANVTVSVGGASTQTFKVFGTSRGRQDIEQITIQLGDLMGATLSNGTAYTVGVTVSGVAADNPNSLQFTPNPGNIWFISPTGNDTTGDGSFANPYLTAQNSNVNTGDASGQCLDATADGDSFANAGAWKYMHRGDVMVLRGGTYTTVGKDNFFLRVQNRRGSLPTGTAGTGPLTIMGYPGETPYIDRSLSSDYDGAPGGGISSADSARQANGCGAYVTITNVKIESGRSEGPMTTQAGYLNPFDSHWRVVNNEMSGVTCSYNTLCRGAGVSGSGAGNFYFGNYIHNMDDKPDASTNDENHGFYLDGGGQTEIAFNWIKDITHGNGIQTYSSSGTDITDVSFHHNIINGTSKHCFNVADGSTTGFVYYDNVAMNCGKAGLRFNTTGLSGMKFYNNTIFNVGASYWALGNDWNLPSGALDFRNNIIVPNGSKAYMSGSVGFTGATGTYTNNLWYGGTGTVLGTSNQTTDPLFVSMTSGSEDLSIQSSSPAIDTGTSAVSATVTNDYDFVIARPQGSAYDIGAYEYVSGAPDTTAPTVTNVSSDTANGTYNAGDVIDIDVTFSEAVTSTGNVTVTLETGTTDRTCTFTVSSGTTGTCNYTVQATDTSADLTVNSITGTVNDASNNPMTTPATPTTNLAANKALVIDTTDPSGSITAPASSATVSGTVSFAASASDNVAVASVQFKVDGTNQGSADTSSPYTISWDTTGASQGSHSLTATITDTAGNTYTTSAVSVTVDNTVASDTTAPSVPTNLTGSAASTSAINLSWTASTDDTAVSLYEVYRSSTLIGSTASTTYQDTGLTAATSYLYSVLAKDAAGNPSAETSQVSVTTQSATVSSSSSSSGGGGGGGSKKKKKKSISGKIIVRPGERAAPWVTLTAPKVGTILPKRFTVSAVSSDKSGIQAMIVTVNGTRKKRANTGSVSYSLARKNMTINVNAYDTLGNRKTVEVRIASGKVVGVRYW